MRFGGEARRVICSSNRARLSSLAIFLTGPASASHSRPRFMAEAGRSSRSRAAASAAAIADAGGGAPPAMPVLPAVWTGTLGPW